MNQPHEDPHVRLLDDARHAQAVADRAQRRLLTEADDQDATFLGSLEEVAETGAVVVLETTVGRRIRGTITQLSGDHVVLEGDHGTAWVRLRAITVLRVDRNTVVRAGGGERARRQDVPLSEALRALVEDRSDVDVVFDGGTSVRGTALAVGRDVLTLRNPATGERALAYLQRACLVVTHVG